MAHNDKVKLRALALYLQSKNYEDIARILKQEFTLKTLSANSVRRWAEEKDDSGATWEDTRKRIQVIMRQNVEDATADLLTDISMKSKTILGSLYDQMIGETAPGVKSLEGAAYAFKTMAEFIIKLDAHQKAELNPFMIVQVMLEIFSEIPAVKKAIEAHWPKITGEIRTRIAYNTDRIIDVQADEVK